MSHNIKVAIKVRPLIKREKENKLSSQWRICNNKISLNDNTSEYCFDHIFDETAPTQVLFDAVVKPIIENCMKGFNGTIFAYGQTSSGKTYTMTGTDTEDGVMSLSFKQIFDEINALADRQYLLRIAYIEIYNEKIYDLLNGAELKIRDNVSGDVKMNSTEIIVNSVEQIMKHMIDGNNSRRMEETNMNERSSRSHTIFRLTIESRACLEESSSDVPDGVVQISNLNLVDLAGSEKADQTGATGSRLKEGSYINKSLFSLGLVIKQLSEKGGDQFINYRDSKLTRILQASLGGNSLTSMICTVTPAVIEETNYTLLFAMRAKTIKNKPIINETVSDATMMKRLENEISKLKQQLKVEQSKNSEIKIAQLIADINERETKFVASTKNRNFEKSRRRTWCPSSTQIPRNLSVVYEEKEEFLKPTSIVNVNFDRCTSPAVPFNWLNDLDNSIHDFSLSENSDKSISSTVLTTPSCFKKSSAVKDDSLRSEGCQCERLEKELKELKEFTRLETKTKFTDIINNETDRESEIHELKDKLLTNKIQLESTASRCSELELKTSRLEHKLKDYNEMEENYKKTQNELKDAIQLKEFTETLKVGVEYEFEQLQKRFATREKELSDMLDEARFSKDQRKNMEKIKLLENQIAELEQEKSEFNETIENEKKKMENFEKINIQLLNDLENEKLKLNEINEINVKLKNDLECEKFKLETLNKVLNQLTENLENEKLKSKQTEEANCELKFKFDSEITDLKQQVNEITILNNQLICDLGNERLKFENMKDSFDTESERKKDLQIEETKEKYDIELGLYKQQIRELQDQIRHIEQQLETQKNDSVETIQEMKNHNLEITTDLTNIKLMYENLNILKRDADQKHFESNNENILLKEEIKKLDFELKKTNTELHEMENLKIKMAEEVKYQIDRSNKLEKELANTKSQIEKNNLQDLENKIISEEDFNNKIEELEHIISELTNELDLERQKSTTEKMFLQDKFENLELRKNEMKERFNDLEKQNSQLVLELNSNKKKVQELSYNSELENIKCKFNDLENEKQELIAQLSIEKENDKLIAELRVEIESEKEKFEKLQLDKEQLVRDIEISTIRVNSLENKITELESDLCNTKSEILNVLHSENEKSSELEIIKSQLSSELERNHTEFIIALDREKGYVQKLEEQSIEIQNLKSQLMEIEKEKKIQELENNELKNKQLQEEIGAYKKQIKELETVKSQLIAELDNNKSELLMEVNCDKENSIILEKRTKELEAIKIQLDLEIEKQEIATNLLKKLEEQLLEFKSLNPESDNIELTEKLKHIITHLNNTKSELTIASNIDKVKSRQLEEQNEELGKLKLQLVELSTATTRSEPDKSNDISIVNKDVSEHDKSNFNNFENDLETKSTPIKDIENLEKQLEDKINSYNLLKNDYDNLVNRLEQTRIGELAPDIRELQDCIIRLLNFIKSVNTEDLPKDNNKNINDYLQDLKNVCSSTSNLLSSERYNSNFNLEISQYESNNNSVLANDYSISEIFNEDPPCRSSPTPTLINHEHKEIELQNRIIDLETQLLSITNKLNREFKAIETQTDSFIYEQAEILKAENKKISLEYEELSTQIVDAIQENEHLKEKLQISTNINNHVTHETNGKIEKLQTDIIAYKGKVDNILREISNNKLNETQMRDNDLELFKTNLFNYFKSISNDFDFDSDLLFQQIKQFINNKNDLENKINTLNANEEKLVELNTIYKEKYDKLIQENEKLQNIVKELRSFVISLREKHEQNSIGLMSVNGHEDEFKDYENEIILIKENFKRLTEETEHLKKCLNDSNEDGILYKTRYEELTIRNRELNENYNSMQIQFSRLQEENNRLIELEIFHRKSFEDSKTESSVVKEQDITKIQNQESEDMFLNESYKKLINENKELNSLNQDLTSKVLLLSQELEGFKITVSKDLSLNEKYSTLVENHEQVLAKIQILKDSENLLKNEAKNLEKQVLLQEERALNEKNTLVDPLESLEQENKVLKDTETLLKRKAENFKKQQILSKDEIEKLIDEKNSTVTAYESLKNSYENLVKENQTLDTKLTAIHDTKNEALTLGNKLNDKCGLLEDQLARLQEENNRLKELEMSLRKNCEDLITESAVATEKNIKKIQSLESEHESLNDLYEKLIGQNKEIDLLNQDLISQVSLLSQELESLKITLSKDISLNEKYSMLVENHELLLTENKTLKDSENLLKREIKNFGKQQISLQEENQKLINEKNTLVNTLELLEQEIKILKDSESLLKSEIKNMEKQQVEFQEKTEKLLNEKKDLVNTFDSLKDTCENLMKEKETQETEFENKFSSIQEIYEQLLIDEKLSKESEHNLKQQNEEMKSELSIVKELNKSLIDQNQQLSFDYKNLKELQNEMEKAHENMVNDNNNLISSNQDLSSQLLMLSNQNENLKTSLSSLEDENKILKESLLDYKSYKEKYSILQQEYDSNQKSQKNLEEQTRKLLHNNSENIEKLSRLNQLQQKQENLVHEHNSLKEKYEKTTTELSFIVNTLENENKQLKDDLNQLVSIKAKLDQLVEENQKLLENENKSKKLAKENYEINLKIKILENEENELKEKIKRLEDENTVLQTKKTELIHQLHELQSMHTFKTTQYESEIKRLKVKNKEKHSKANESDKNSYELKKKLQVENINLKQTNQKLNLELESMRSKTIPVSKSRRQSSYDNNRSSLYDTKSIEIQTDKTDSNCNCDLMNEKLQQLKKEIMIKDCQLTNLKLQVETHPIKLEYSNLKDLNKKLELEKIGLENENRQLHGRLKLKLDKNAKNVSIQTDKIILQQIQNNDDAVLRLRKTNDDLRIEYRNQEDELRILKKVCNEKEKELVKCSQIRNSYKEQLQKLKEESKPKTMNENTQTDISVDLQHLNRLESENQRLEKKYEDSKWLAIARRKKIDELENKLKKS